MVIRDKSRLRRGRGEYSEDQKRALSEAPRMIHGSGVRPYVEGLYLYGSLARHSQRFDSDVDLLLVLSERIREVPDYEELLHRTRVDFRERIFGRVQYDLKIQIGQAWRESRSAYFDSIRRDGINIWRA